MKAKLGGYRPGTYSADDLKFDDVVNNFQLTEAKTSTGADLRKWCYPVEDQSQAGSCVGNAVVGALELLRSKEGLPHLDLSRLFVYYNARLMDRIEDKDDGSSIKLAMGTLSSLGTCSESKWPYDLSKLFVRPSWGSYREAYANKIDAYYKISGSGKTRNEFIMRALDSGFPVVFGMTVDDDYQMLAGDGMLNMPRETRSNPGRHAQVIVGYDDSLRRFIVRNSWGPAWGDNGYAYVPYDYLDVSEANDFWVPMRA